jgi:V/A-type H+/Na+-transporting ATPase subunit E
MTGLEKILKAIEEEAKSSADAYLAQAKQEADEITEAARKEAEKKCAEIAAKSETDIKAVLSRAESAAALQEKKIILEAKQQMINEVITSARNSLTNLSDSEYVEVILRMVQKYADQKPGQILFSAADRMRLPGDFTASLAKALTGKSGASLTISNETANINGGFVLKYGEVEENCSFDALFSAAKEELQDKVNSVLFE